MENRDLYRFISNRDTIFIKIFKKFISNKLYLTLYFFAATFLVCFLAGDFLVAGLLAATFLATTFFGAFVFVTLTLMAAFHDL